MFKNLRVSKKLFMAIIAGAVIILNDGLGWHLDKDTVMSVAGVAITYIVGQSAVDRKLVDNGHKTK